MQRDCRDRDRNVVGFKTTYGISAYHHWCCEFEARSWRCVLDTALSDKVCQWLAAGLWFSPCTLVSSTNKTDRHDINEILLKVSLNTNPFKCVKETSLPEAFNHRGSQLYFHITRCVLKRREGTFWRFGQLLIILNSGLYGLNIKVSFLWSKDLNWYFCGKLFTHLVKRYC